MSETTLYPGFSTEPMDSIFALSARVGAMAAVEAAVATAQGAAGSSRPMLPTRSSPRVLSLSVSRSWPRGGRLVRRFSGCSTRLRSRLPESASAIPAPWPDDAGCRRHGDDDAVTSGVGASGGFDPGCHPRRLAGDHRPSGEVATQARSFLQPADVTTVGFRTARWLDQLDQVRRRIGSIGCPCNWAG